jgi:hypothetical protein
MRYYATRDGFLVRWGTCAEGELPVIEGCVVTHGAPPADLPMPPEPEKTYSELRRRDYPPIGDQLDALWKGGAAMAEMRAQIEAVKLRHPKSGV